MTPFFGPVDASNITPQGRSKLYAWRSIVTEISLHLPRKRKPILTVGMVRLLCVLADLAIWVGIVCWARHVWG